MVLWYKVRFDGRGRVVQGEVDGDGEGNADGDDDDGRGSAMMTKRWRAAWCGWRFMETASIEFSSSHSNFQLLLLLLLHLWRAHITRNINVALCRMRHFYVYKHV